MKRSNLTRKDLAKAINEKMGFSQRGAGDLVDAVFDTLKKALLTEEAVKLVQFGTFNVRKKAPRKGRNPRTGAAMEISRRSMISFRPSKIVREKINQS
ncbi:MAG: integration host factor subunit alpha [Thermodesulfobacteriota bacterium]